MLLSEHYNFLFIAIQKTGTASIENGFLDHYSDSKNLIVKSDLKHKGMLGQSFKIDNKHNTMQDMKDNAKVNDFDKLFKFSFVRNPWDLCVSHYFYQRKKGYEYAVNANFKDWLLSHKKHSLMYQAKTQYDCLSIDGYLRMDFIGRFENIQKDFNKICKYLDIPKQKLNHYNKSNHNFHKEYYDEETIDWVRNKFIKDIEEFNYIY